MRTAHSTSVTNPIRVDFLPRELLGSASGGLGLTICPGKTDSAGRSAAHARDLAGDLRRLRDAYGVDTLVSLITDAEFALLRVPTLRHECSLTRIESLAFSIPDGGVPANVEAFSWVVRNVIQRVLHGQTVLLHCRGGLGRAGTFAACVLASLGHSPGWAMTHVRSARTGAIENSEQERFVRTFSKSQATLIHREIVGVLGPITYQRAVAAGSPATRTRRLA